MDYPSQYQYNIYQENSDGVITLMYNLLDNLVIDVLDNIYRSTLGYFQYNLDTTNIYLENLKDVFAWCEIQIENFKTVATYFFTGGSYLYVIALAVISYWSITFFTKKG